MRGMHDVLAALPDALIIVGADGHVRYVNSAAEELFGRPSDELVGRALPFHVADGDYLDHDPGSGPRKLHARTSVLTWEGAPARLLALRVATGRDALGLDDQLAPKLLELARATVLIRHKEEELRRVSDELERFVYFASHDLKSPLRAVEALATWIQDDLGESLQGETAEHMRLLRARIKRMDRLLDDILVYSRAGRNVAEPEEVDVGKLVADLSLLLDVPGGMEIEADPSLPTFTTRRVLLLQVLHNLVGNAVKHHDGPPGRVRVGADPTELSWSFWVQDDGPGIPPRFQERIFGMFQTLKRRDEVEGSGMGLALVRKIVEAQGGRVEVTSGEGRGACFRFAWPRSEGSLLEER